MDVASSHQDVQATGRVPQKETLAESLGCTCPIFMLGPKERLEANEILVLATVFSSLTRQRFSSTEMSSSRNKVVLLVLL